MMVEDEEFSTSSFFSDRGIDRKSVVVDQKLKSILNDRFFRETTMHGFSHLSNAASVQGVIFWMIVTLSAFAMAGYQIINDFRKLYSEEMTISFRQPKIKDDENKLPRVNFCYNTWIHWFDFQEAYRVKNLTGEEIRYLSSTFAGHLIPRGQCVNHTKVRRSLIGKFGTVIQLDEVMKNLMLKDLRKRCQKKNANCYFTPMPSKLCMQFALSKIAQNAKEVIYFNRLDVSLEFSLGRNDKQDEIDVVGHLLMNSKTFTIVVKESDVVGHDFVVMPSAVNMPASHAVDCPKINEPTFHEAHINGISPVIAAKLFCKKILEVNLLFVIF
uniref:Uncharacterized protein n=1 Tax=Romanomermis culicivorax TaxID=13658 RepID=A0A915KLU6_ROMCU